MTSDVKNVKPYPKKATINRNVCLQEGDIELMNWCAEFLGTSKSEVMRSALRSFAISLQKIDRGR